MLTIKLTQGQRARVDWQDYKELCRYRWHASWAKNTRSFMAGRYNPNTGSNIKMHRQLMRLSPGDGLHVDHKNHDTLDNRRRNLRVCINRENHENRRYHSKFGVGVHYDHTRRCPYRLRVMVGGRRIHVGDYASPEEAVAVRQRFVEGLSSEC